MVALSKSNSTSPGKDTNVPRAVSVAPSSDRRVSTLLKLLEATDVEAVSPLPLDATGPRRLTATSRKNLRLENFFLSHRPTRQQSW